MKEYTREFLEELAKEMLEDLPDTYEKRRGFMVEYMQAIELTKPEEKDEQIRNLVECLEVCIESFKSAENDFQRGRRYQSERILETLNKIKK